MHVVDGLLSLVLADVISCDGHAVSLLGGYAKFDKLSHGGV